MKHIRRFNESISDGIKKSEITKTMFEEWKDDCREEFKSDPNSMNLVNICLKAIDVKNTDDSKIEAFNKRLLEFYECELARSGKLLCDSCGSNMEVYYTVKCFKCEAGKPKVENNQGNLIMSARWLENNDADFSYQEFWDALLSNDMIQNNDSYIRLHDTDRGKYGRLIQIWKKHFPIENTLWEVSW